MRIVKEGLWKLEKKPGDREEPSFKDIVIINIIIIK